MKYRKTYVKYKTGGSQNDNSETGINRILEMDDIEYYDFINQFIHRYFKYPNRPYLIRKIIIEAEKDPILYFYDDDRRGVIYVDGRIYSDFIEAFANIDRPKFNKFVKKVMSNSGYPHIDLVYFEYRDRLYSYFYAYPDYIQGVIDKLGIVIKNPLLTLNAKIHLLLDQPREKLNRICLDIIGVSLDTFGDEGYIPQPLYPPPRDDHDDEDLDTRSDQWYFSPPSGDDRLL